MKKCIFKVKRNSQRSVELDVISDFGNCDIRGGVTDWFLFTDSNALREQAKEFLDAYNALTYYAEKLEGD